MEALCVAMSRVKGIGNVVACNSIDSNPVCVMFRTKGLKYLKKIVFWFQCFHDWRIVAELEENVDMLTFKAVGPAGEKGLKEAEEIALMIRSENERRNKSADDKERIA